MLALASTQARPLCSMLVAWHAAGAHCKVVIGFPNSIHYDTHLAPQVSPMASPLDEGDGLLTVPLRHAGTLGTVSTNTSAPPSIPNACQQLTSSARIRTGSRMPGNPNAGLGGVPTVP